MEDLIMQGASLVITALIGWGVTILKAKTGIEISEKHQRSLHSALMTGARLAAAKQLTGAKAIDLAIDYAKKSVPDAIDYLRPTYNVLENLAESKIEDLLGWRVELGGEDKLADALKDAIGSGENQ